MLTIINTPWFAVAWKRHWCGFYWLNEDGLAALQFGPIVVEIVLN